MTLILLIILRGELHTMTYLVCTALARNLEEDQRTSRYDAEPQKLSVSTWRPQSTCRGAKLLYMPARMV